MISRIKELLGDIKDLKGKSVYENVFNKLLPLFKEEFERVYPQKNVGRKRTIDIIQVFKAIYFIARSGSQYDYVYEHFNICKSTFIRYLKKINEKKIVDNVFQRFLLEVKYDKTFIIDTFTVKSMDGHEGLGRNSCDRGRQGLKVHLIIDIKGIQPQNMLQYI